MPLLICSCVLLSGDLLKPWAYYLVEEQWTLATVFEKIMRGELSSCEAYAIDIDQAEHRLVKVSAECIVIVIFLAGCSGYNVQCSIDQIYKRWSKCIECM